MIEFGFNVWVKKYEQGYGKYIERNSVFRQIIDELRGRYMGIGYVDDSGNLLFDDSPYFESVSKVFQERGFLYKEEFVYIGIWKTQRQTKNYEKNPDEEIKSRSKLAISSHPDINEQLEALIELKGVSIPVASAILTVIFPNDYCVIDYRAWRALQWVMEEPIELSNI